MSGEIVPSPHLSPFDAIRKVDRRGDSWSARELMAHFGYARWDDVRDGITRASAAITNALGETAAQTNIEPDLKKVRVGYGEREIEDFRLTRYGAYMWAMNGDPRKPEIAAAQTYFAVRTREAEVARRPASGIELLESMVAELRAQHERTTVLEAKVSAIEGAHDWFTCLAYAKLHDHATDRPYLAKVGKKATALMRQRGEEPRKRQDATFGEINTYPAAVLEQAFEAVRR